MDVCVDSDRIAVRRRVLRPLELLQQLRCPSLPVSGLVLDLCGVLYDDSVWRRWLFQLISHMGLRTEYTAFFRLWRREYLEQVKRGQCDYWQALRSFLQAAGMTRGQIEEIEAAGHARREAMEADIHPLPGVVATLAFLAEREVQLTLLSSSWLSLPEVQTRLARLRLEDRFQSVVSSADLYSRSAEPDGFLAAIGLTGCPVSHLVYVGCDTAALRRATEVGLRTVAFNHDEDAQADFYLERFDRLPEVLPFDIARRAAG